MQAARDAMYLIRIGVSLCLVFVVAIGTLAVRSEDAEARRGGCPPDVETCIDDAGYMWTDSEGDDRCVWGGCMSEEQFCCLDVFD